MLQSLHDKVIIITGASSGIGAATARLLVENGGRVVITARSADKLQALQNELGDSALSVPGDVTAAGDVANVVQATLTRFGRIDALLANAGIYIPGEFTDGDPEAFANLMNVNINGVLRYVHAVLPQMRAQQSGDIIVSSSISGFVDIHWEPVYSASKHAVQGFVHTLRRQVAAEGIRVGAIAPGMVANELWGITEAAAIDDYVTRHAALRSEDVATAIHFMLAQPPHVTIRDLVMLPQNQDI